MLLIGTQGPHEFLSTHLHHCCRRQKRASWTSQWLKAISTHILLAKPSQTAVTSYQANFPDDYHHLPFCHQILSSVFFLCTEEYTFSSSPDVALLWLETCGLKWQIASLYFTPLSLYFLHPALGPGRTICIKRLPSSLASSWVWQEMRKRKLSEVGLHIAFAPHLWDGHWLAS